ncbi:MAG: hypothetical protein J1F11_01280 [Oscillospiraceae bacterium]|nr:hypothetical protein [Oscillospiraceae bacterium]
MRITENITKGMYLRNHNRSQSSLLKSYTRIMTQRQFNRVSEDTINGNNAMSLRRQLRNLKMYNTNLSTAKELFNAAETNLNKIGHDLYISVEENLVAAVNGTWSQQERDIYAQELNEIAEEMVNCLNGDFAERNIFGGTNNSSAPFRLERVLMFDDTGTEVEQKDADGNYIYNYTDPDGNKLIATEKEIQEMVDEHNKALLNDPDDPESGYRDDVDPDEIWTTDSFAQGDKFKAKEVVYPPNWKEYYEYDADGNINVKEGIALDDIPRTVLYNGVPVSFDALGIKEPADMRYDVVTVNVAKNGNFDYKHSEFMLSEETIKYAQLNNDNSCIFPGSKPVYVDIGIGIRYDNKYEVDPQTALDISINGAAVAGCGMETDIEGKTFSKNLIQLVLDAAEALKRGDRDYANDVIDRANLANNGVLTQITTLGSKQNDIAFYEDRNKDYDYNLKERQNLIEGTDMEAEIMNWYNLQAAYDAFLKIGTSVIPSSIFDFV